MRSDLTSSNSLVFAVKNRGTYTTGDDGAAVSFPGGGKGTLLHINGANIAYITGCAGTPQAGTVTCASAHTFEIAVQLEGLGNDPFGNERVGFSGTTQISRKDFGLTWNVALESGGLLVSDKVAITLDVSAIRVPVPA